MSLVMGIDPGSRITGYGLVKRESSRLVYVDSGVIRVDAKRHKHERLLQIKEGLDGVLGMYRPESVAVEEVFVARNPKSALTLGEARGVAILAVAQAGIELFEYSAREVKRSVVGTGAAHKSQVAAMIGRLLAMNKEPATEDETDALAIAFCHSLRLEGFGRPR